MTHKRYERADDGLLSDIEAALELVGGASFQAAAKLLDLEPNRFRNLVNGNPSLKAKWGRKERGKPKGLKFKLRIEPYVAPKPYLEPWRGGLLAEAKGMILKHLSPAQMDELATWLDWLRSQRDLKREDQQSMAEWAESKAA